MHLSNIIHKLGWFSLVSVFLVITAGSTVRATGSGMGCPDWPKCYGYTIPPTDISEVTWSSGREFHRGQMIIHQWTDERGAEDRLLVAQQTFTTGAAFVPDKWSPYERHDYAIFNPVHTWIEFINRLMGAFSGFPVLLLTAFAFVHAAKNRQWPVAFWSVATLGGLGFVAWLGKLVVDGNLIPGSITIHMFGSIVIVGCLLLVIRHGREKLQVTGNTRWWCLAALLLTLFQVYVGTQVREEIDVLAKACASCRETWVDDLSWMFVLHRTYNWLLVGVHAAWLYQLMKSGTAQARPWEWYATIALIALQIGVGLILTYAGFPAVGQPVHLVGAIMLVAVTWSVFLKMSSSRS